MKKTLTLSALALFILLYGAAFSLASEQAPAAKTQNEQEANQDSGLISGKVIETMDSGGYSYVLLETKAGQEWVAVPKTKVTKGQNASFMQGVMMENFESKTLKRKFDKIIFSAGPANASTAPAKAQGAAEEPHSPGSKGTVVKTTEKIKIEKASGPNAYTVEEIFKKSGSLDKKAVVIKAKVVKISEGIMSKNWVHVQDGTGNPEKGTSDLVVTSKDLPSVGDVVIVNGTLAKDKDFGSGYKYKVIVEDGTFKK